MFRLDINALRFLAVISVVLFHFKMPYTSGGYSGVDIFFVISGYLMHHMLSKNTLNRENIIIFYKRQFSRIFPALAVCLFIFSIVSTILSPLSLLNSIRNQVLSAATFTSNLFFTNALSSYFSQTADSYIFLHTWSLGLEFQYYLIFPLVLLAIRKLKFDESLAIAFIAGLSLIFCLVMVNINQTVTFYNLPFRAWELLAGAYASSIGDVVKLKPKTKKLVEVTCICGILAFVIFGDSPSSWPDAKATIPTLLTFIILILKVDNECVALKNPFFQG
ncbi:acyltransferase family protein [Rahnella sp. PCH160]|uniref:acyltransferase family protein n=1 Tax=Rahnella sp. PCH160 TaxID=3447928 RepID=UPI0039FB9D30